MSGTTYTSQSEAKGLSYLGGGLNSTANGLAVADDEATDLLNVDFDITGSIKKRNGYTRLNTTTVEAGKACTGLYNAEFSTSTTFVGVFEENLRKMDDLDGTWDSVTVSGATITSGATNLCSFSMLNDILVFTNGNDVPIKWIGTGNAVGAGVPSGLTKSKFVTTWENYMFYANVTVSSTVHPSRIYWSNIKDPDTWTATDWVEVGKNDGQKITGIHPLGDRLVVFKDRSIYCIFFTGDSDVPFTVSGTSSSVGCVSGYSIQKVDNGLIFLSNDGYYYFDGQDSVKKSDRITTTLGTFEESRFQYVTSCYQRSKNRYWSPHATSGGTTHGEIVTYDTFNDAFSLYDSMSISYICTLYTGGEERVYFGDYTGFTYRADSGTSDHPNGTATATAIEAYWKSKWFNMGNIMEEKGVPHIVFYHQIASTLLQLSYSYNFESAAQNTQTIYLGTSSATYGSALYGTDTYASSGGLVKRRDLTGRGKVMRLELSNLILNETFQIDGIGFYPHLETVA